MMYLFFFLTNRHQEIEDVQIHISDYTPIPTMILPAASETTLNYIGHTDSVQCLEWEGQSIKPRPGCNDWRNAQRWTFA